MTTTAERAHRSMDHLRSFIALGIGNYGAMLLSMALNAILTRRLGAERFGALALLLTTSQVIALGASNWTHSAMVRFAALEFSAKGTVVEALWTRIWITLPWALAPLAAAAVAGPALARYLGIPSWGLLIVWLHFLAGLAIAIVGAAFQAKQQMSRYGAVLFLDKAVMVAVVLLAPHAVREPLAVVACYAASSTLVAIGGLAALGRRDFLPVAFNAPAYRAMFLFAAPLILSNWAGLFGTSWFDFIVLKAHRPAVELGWYSLGTLLAGVLQQIAIISSTLVLPKFTVMVAKGELEKIRILTVRVLPYWFLATTVLFSVAAIGGVTIVPLVFGREFLPSASVLAVLMTAASAFALFSIFSSLLSAAGSTWALTGIGFLSSAVNVVADLLLIPPYGILGAAAATVLAYGMSACLVLMFVQRRLQLSVLSLSSLSIPVAIVTVAFLLLDGTAFYLLAVGSLVASVLLLIRRFDLFDEHDVTLLRSLNPRALWGTR